MFQLVRWPLLVGALLSALALNASAAAEQLQDVRINVEADKARITLDLQNSSDYHSFSLHSPERFVIDLPNTHTKLNGEEIKHSSRLIEHVRISKNHDSVRLVFDLKTAARPHVFILPQAHPPLKRLVADLTFAHEVAPPAKIPEEPKPIITKTKNPAPILTDKVESVRDVIVTVDAGHGGKDPGAMGASGTQEKNIVLAIAQQLTDLINREPGMHAVMTRDGDYYIGLRQRLLAARKHNADIFVAIHADAYNKRDSSGASVFALSPHGASSEAARWLAERENHSELGDVSLTDKSMMLRSVLLDLSQTATIVDSLHLGEDILSNLGKMTRLHNQQVEQAPFMVLKSPDIPSVLVETGFISNPSEEEKLSSAAYRYSLARAITRGIVMYFQTHPPSGTRFANNHDDSQDAA